MTVMERLKTFLRNDFNRAYCDECLFERIAGADRRKIGYKLQALQHDPGFSRGVQPCVACGRTDVTTTRATMIQLTGSAA